MTTKSKKNTKLDTADRLGMAMLAPARECRDRLGDKEYTARLCTAMGWKLNQGRIQQVRGWLSEDARVWQHPRAGVVKAMLDVSHYVDTQTIGN